MKFTLSTSLALFLIAQGALAATTYDCFPFGNDALTPTRSFKLTVDGEKATVKFSKVLTSTSRSFKVEGKITKFSDFNNKIPNGVEGSFFQNPKDTIEVPNSPDTASFDIGYCDGSLSSTSSYSANCKLAAKKVK